MEGLVTPEPDTLQMKGCECVIDARHPLGHSHVVSVFRFKEKFEVQVSQRAVEPARPAIGSYFRQREAALADEPSPSLPVHRNCVWTGCAVRSLDHIVIKKGRANRYLRLFQAQHTIVMPGRLAKGHERYGMNLASRIVGFNARVNLCL